MRRVEASSHYVTNLYSIMHKVKQIKFFYWHKGVHFMIMAFYIHSVNFLWLEIIPDIPTVYGGIRASL